MRNHRRVVLARIKKRLGLGAARPVAETAAAKAPLAHDEVTYRAQSSPAAKTPLAEEEGETLPRSSSLGLMRASGAIPSVRIAALPGVGRTGV